MNVLVIIVINGVLILVIKRQNIKCMWLWFAQYSVLPTIVFIWLSDDGIEMQQTNVTRN